MNPVDPPDLTLWPTLRHLYPLWREQWRLVVLGVSCALAFTGLSLLIPILIQRAIDGPIDTGDVSALMPYLGAILVVATLRFGINYTRRFATARIGVAVEARLRGMLYDAYLRFPRAFYDRHATGEVISRATNDIYPVRYFIGWGVVQAMQSTMMLVGAAIVLANVNARLALFAAVAMPAVAVLTYVFARRVFPISREVQRRKGHLTEASDEAVVGIEMVQAFGREDDVRDRFHDRAEAVRSETMRQASVEAHFLPGLIFLPTLSIAAVLYFGGRDAIAGELTIGEFTLFVALLLQLVWPLEALGWIMNLAQRATAAASRSFAWLEGIDALPESPRPTALPEGPLSVELENVSFRYGTGGDVLSGVTLRADPGEIVAVCGATGAGKSSLLNLVPRFYDPTEGRVLVGGVDTRELSLARLRDAVAIVTQKPVLFSVPLRDNLLTARPDADWSDVLARLRGRGSGDLRRRSPRRVRHADRRAWCQPLGRPASAGRARTRADRGRADHRARRSHVGGRHRDRAPSGRDTATGPRRADSADRGAAPLDDPRRRPGCRATRRHGRRGGRAAEADGAWRRLHGVVRRRDPCCIAHTPGCHACGGTRTAGICASASSQSSPPSRPQPPSPAGTSSATRSTTASERPTRAGSLQTSSPTSQSA